MPEVFEHAFALLGERIEDHVELERLDPAYRLFPEPVDGGPSEPFDVVGDAETNWATFEAREPGAGEAIRRYTQDSTQAYRTALDSFLYTTFARPDRLLSARRRQAVGDARRAADGHARRQGRGDGDRPGAPAGARLPRGVPRVLAVPGPGAVLAHEPPGPRRRRTFPPRRDVHGHRGARADRPQGGRRRPHGRRRRGDRDRRRRPVAPASAQVRRGPRGPAGRRDVRPGRRRRVRRRPAPHGDRAAGRRTASCPRRGGRTAGRGSRRC